MWLAILALRNWRHPFTITLVGLGLVLWAVILVGSYGDVTCQNERMGPGDTCVTTQRYSDEVVRTQTYEQMREDQQRWTPILVPVFLLVGVPLAALGIVSAHRQGVLWRGSGGSKAVHTDEIGTSAYAAQVAQAAAAPRPGRPAPPPPPPPSLHHDI